MWCDGTNRYRRDFIVACAKRIVALAALFAVAPVLHAHAETPPCETVTFETRAFTVCTANPAEHAFRMYLNAPNGEKYGSLDALPADDLLFATNAGMYTPEYEPAGLYVENGVERKRLNTRKSGYGNFHLQPNGVFWVKGRKAAVTSTNAYARLMPRADLATQSGPMLVIDGKLNPRFDEDGPSRYIRNGIGVTKAGRVAIAISEVPVSFGAFARLFRDHLKCPNALYFDGSVSQLRIAGQFRPAFGPRLGPMLGVYRARK